MSKQSYMISIDLGTQGTKTALIAGNGQMMASSTQPTHLDRRAGGIVEQDPYDMLDSVIKGIKAVIEASKVDANLVASIGISGQMAGILGIDEQGKAITPYDSWLDTRCSAYFDTIKAWGEEEYIQLTGCPVTYAHGPKILWWKNEHPEIYREISRFVLPTTYIALCLTGGKDKDAYIDYTHLHFSGFADVENKRWSDTLLNAFDIDASKLPNIVSPWDIVGNLIPSLAQYCGLPAGIPVVAGCGDTAAATLGAGIIHKGMAFDVAGTASVLSCCVDKYSPDTVHKTLIYSRSVLPGLWNPLAYINGGGQCLSWFREQLASSERTADFNDLNLGAEAIAAGSDGLYFIPHFGGRVCPNNAILRGAWVGLNWSHTKFAMYRSIMESIAYEYKGYLNILQQCAGSQVFSQVNVVGGGARGDIFNHIKSDVLGIPYATLKNSDTGHLANAAIAGYGVGLFADIAETIQGWVAEERVYEPDLPNHQSYSLISAKYPKLLAQMTEIQQQLIEE